MPPRNKAPTAWFNITQIDGLVVALECVSTDKNGTILTRRWSFGDGEYASGTRVSHRYKEPGTYRIRLEVTDNGGLRSVATKDVTLRVLHPPTAAFTITAA